MSEAVENAVKRVAITVKNIYGVDMLCWTAKVQGNTIVEHNTNVKGSFIVEEIVEQSQL